MSAPRRRKPRARWLSAAGGILCFAAGLALGAAPARAQPTEARGGYWRDAGGDGHYRAQVLSPGPGARVLIEWIASGPGDRVVASATLEDWGARANERLVNPELRAEGDRTLLLLSAFDPSTGALRTLSFELGPPRHFRLRE
jgi:hypothetical protein